MYSDDQRGIYIDRYIYTYIDRSFVLLSNSCKYLMMSGKLNEFAGGMGFRFGFMAYNDMMVILYKKGYPRVRTDIIE